ncbi:MAG: hypothetical protein IT359_03780 [Gemmatimonadaceae bacterium]|nr:hypothetical protein [Gemmatimonadaceae bacterium]
MTSPFRLNPIKTATVDASVLAAANPSAFAAVRPEISKVVDLEATKTKATIVRGTESVETPEINITRASGILDAFIPIPRVGIPRGVKQSIAPGTLVARGTAIDIEFLAPDLVQLGLFEGVHLDLRARTVPAVATLLDDPEVVAALKKDSTTLTAAERQNVSVKLAAAGVTVDDTSADKSFGAALVGLKSAQAFR